MKPSTAYVPSHANEHERMFLGGIRYRDGLFLYTCVRMMCPRYASVQRICTLLEVGGTVAICCLADYTVARLSAARCGVWKAAGARRWDGEVRTCLVSRD